MKTHLRRRAAAVAATLLVPVLASCGSGFDYQTDQVYQPSVGVNDRDGEVDVLNAVVVSAVGGSGTLVTSFVNNDVTTADEFVGATGEGLSVPTAAVAIPADALVNLADDKPITLKGESIVIGSFVRLTLSFANAEDVVVNVPVVPHTGDFASVTVEGPAAPVEAEEEEAEH